MKKLLYWILAFVIAVGSMIYQRRTGPTHPKRAALEVSDVSYKFKLPRSQSGEVDSEVQLHIPDNEIDANLIYRRYPTNEPWDTAKFIRDGELLTAYLPNQPPAGKIEYYVEFSKGVVEPEISKSSPVYIRFTGAVPDPILITHVIFMIISVYLGILAGIMAVGNYPRFRFNTFMATIFLFMGGLILGPIVQKYAFGDLWTGFPFGMDLTDNKTLIAFLFWLAATIGNWKKERRWLTIMAALVLLAIYLIPHSAMGSELDYSSGEVTTGVILPVLF